MHTLAPFPGLWTEDGPTMSPDGSHYRYGQHSDSGGPHMFRWVDRTGTPFPGPDGSWRPCPDCRDVLSESVALADEAAAALSVDLDVRADTGLAGRWYVLTRPTSVLLDGSVHAYPDVMVDPVPVVEVTPVRAQVDHGADTITLEPLDRPRLLLDPSPAEVLSAVEAARCRT